MQPYRIPLSGLCMLANVLFATSPIPSLPEGLLLDLDAERGLTVAEDGFVTAWENQAPGNTARVFRSTDEGIRQQNPGSGRPRLRPEVPELGGHASLVFEEDELINFEEDAFDHLTTGSGYTWFTVLMPYETPLGDTEFGIYRLQDVNSFIGNLRNSDRYCGFWGCFDDDLTFWVGSRNDITFGRFDANNPKLSGPQLSPHRFYVLAARMGAGTVNVQIEIFVNNHEAVGQVAFPVNPDADPSKLAIGTERDATNHPGSESFDGEIARVLIYERPLTDTELKRVFTELVNHYQIAR